VLLVFENEFYCIILYRNKRKTILIFNINFIAFFVLKKTSKIFFHTKTSKKFNKNAQKKNFFNLYTTGKKNGTKMRKKTKILAQKKSKKSKK